MVDPAPATADPSAGRFHYAGLTRLAHERARLGLLMALADAPTGLLFAEVRAACRLTDGNLNRHLAALIDAGWVEMWKKSRQGTSQTRLILTSDGREGFRTYLRELRQVLGDATDRGLLDET
jgi:DNA-binding MarR family transcriptional regulator